MRKYEVLKQNNIDMERQKIFDFYQNKNWESVYKQRNKMSSADLTFLSYKAIANFLPAFLLYCILEKQEADMICDALADLLKDKTLRKILRYYNQQQKKVVLEIQKEWVKTT